MRPGRNQAIPQPGSSWQTRPAPARYPHAYVRGGTAKLLTLFHPATGPVRARGVTRNPNAVLHAWLKAALSALVAALPPREPTAVLPTAAATRATWERWQEGLSVRFTRLEQLPPVRVLLILDNRTGHQRTEWVCWLMAHGIMPLYTPLDGSWLNMAESVQRLLVGRGLSGQYPESAAQLITWLEAVTRGWNASPVPFHGGGKRAARRQRARERQGHRLSGSGAVAHQPPPRRATGSYRYAQTN